jgi:hypothetical protein
VSVVHHQPRILPAAQRSELTQWRTITIHTEDTVNHHQPRPFNSGEFSVKICNIIVGKAAKASAAVQPSIEQRGVIQSILKDIITGLQQAGQSARIGCVARGEKQGARPASHFSQRFLQLMVRAAMAADQVRGSTANTVLAGRPLETFHQARVSRQAKIVIATKVEIVPTLHSHNWALSGIQGQALTIKPLLLALCKARAQPLFEAHHVTNQTDAAS